MCCLYHDMVEEDLSWMYDDMFDPHETVGLFYDAGINRFIDMKNGDIVNDIYRLVTPSDVFLFKRKKESITIPDRSNTFLVEMVYPDYLYVRKYS